MRTFTSSVRYLALLLVAACGDDLRALPDVGSVPDAGSGSGPPLPDAPPVEMSGPLERLDWRATRGAPLAASTVTIPAAEMFAVSGDGFVTRSESSPGSTFTWHDLAGTPRVRRDHMTRVTTTSVSPDGGR